MSPGKASQSLSSPCRRKSQKMLAVYEIVADSGLGKRLSPGFTRTWAMSHTGHTLGGTLSMAGASKSASWGEWIC